MYRKTVCYKTFVLSHLFEISFKEKFFSLLFSNQSGQSALSWWDFPFF